MASGLSRLPIVISMRPGMNEAVKLIWVPQVGQKPRLASGDEAWTVGRALVNTTCPTSNMAHATAGAALALRHMEQWHNAVIRGRPVIS